MRMNPECISKSIAIAFIACVYLCTVIHIQEVAASVPLQPRLPGCSSGLSLTGSIWNSLLYQPIFSSLGFSKDQHRFLGIVCRRHVSWRDQGRSKVTSKVPRIRRHNPDPPILDSSWASPHALSYPWSFLPALKSGPPSCCKLASVRSYVRSYTHYVRFECIS